jgi:hypothetical protein
VANALLLRVMARMTAPVRDELLLRDVPLNDHAALQNWVIAEHMPDAQAARREQAKQPGRPPHAVAYLATVQAAYLQELVIHGTAIASGRAVAKRLGVAKSLPPIAEDRLIDALTKLDPTASFDEILSRLDRYVDEAAALLAEEKQLLVAEDARREGLRRDRRHA